MDPRAFLGVALAAHAMRREGRGDHAQCGDYGTLGMFDAAPA